MSDTKEITTINALTTSSIEWEQIYNMNIQGTQASIKKIINGYRLTVIEVGTGQQKYIDIDFNGNELSRGNSNIALNKKVVSECSDNSDKYGGWTEGGCTGYLVQSGNQFTPWLWERGDYWSCCQYIPSFHRAMAYSGTASSMTTTVRENDPNPGIRRVYALVTGYDNDNRRLILDLLQTYKSGQAHWNYGGVNGYAYPGRCVTINPGHFDSHTWTWNPPPTCADPWIANPIGLRSSADRLSSGSWYTVSIPDGKTNWDGWYGIDIEKDCEYVVVGASDSNDAYIIKINYKGDIKWSIKYGGPDAYGLFVIQTSDGGYLMLGSKSGQLWTLKLSADSIPTTIDMTPSQTAYIGDTLQLSAYVKDQWGAIIPDALISWGSSNPSIGAIDSAGMFTALTEGTVTIATTCCKIVGYTTITVENLVVSIEVTPTSATVIVPNTEQFVATARGVLGNVVSVPITWTSSDPSIGTIDGAGLFRSISRGDVTIAANYRNVYGSANVQVIIPPKIISYVNSATMDSSTDIGSGINDLIIFDISSDQEVTWHWLFNGIEQYTMVGTSSEYIDRFKFKDIAYTVQVYGTNVNGQTDVLTWTVTTDEKNIRTRNGWHNAWGLIYPDKDDKDVAKDLWRELKRSTTGQVVPFITTPLGAEIFIDGIDTGQTTPANIIDIIQGTHSYTLRLANHRDYIGTVDVISGQIIPVFAILQLMAGDLQITANVREAKIFIDDIDTGLYTPATIHSLVAGIHTYRLSKFGYFDSIGTIDIVPNTTVVLSVTMTAMTTTCQIFDSVPVGARIIIDGWDLGITTPVNLCEIPQGYHSFELEGTFTIEEKGRPIQHFTTVPKGTIIYVDGVYMGEAPIVMTNISVGTHRYVLIGSFST